VLLYDLYYDGYYCGDLRLAVVDPPETAQVQSIILLPYIIFIIFYYYCALPAAIDLKRQQLYLYIYSRYTMMIDSSRFVLDGTTAGRTVTLARNDI